MGYAQQSVALLAVSVALPLLPAVTIALRIHARALARKKLDWSEYFIFFAMLNAVCNSITCIIGAVLDGVGQPLSTLSSKDQTGFMKVLFATQFFYIFSAFSVKVSILLFYKSLFVSDKFRKSANAMLAILGLWIVAFFFVTLFQDKPISRNWGTNGTTVNFPVLYIVEAVTNMALDLAILCMPLAVIRTLQITTRKKWYLGGIFWLGAFCVVASAVRLYYFVLLKQEYRDRNDDFSATAVNTVLWGEIEPCMSIFAACLPTLATLLPGRSHGSRRASQKASYTLDSVSRIHKQTSVNVTNQPLDSVEHLTREAAGNQISFDMENGNGRQEFPSARREIYSFRIHPQPAHLK